MHKRSTHLLLLVVLVLAVVVLMLSNAAAGPMSSSTSGAIGLRPLQVATPEAAKASTSESGSTDGIMWMGLVIAAIILLPILIQKSVWH